jgi:hypothetical protein
MNASLMLKVYPRIHILASLCKIFEMLESGLAI